MPDLNERLRGIDRLSPPDLLSEARVKAEEASSRRSGVAATPLRRLATIVIALVVGLSGAAGLFLAFGREQRTEPAAPVPGRIVFSSLIFPDAPGQIYAMAPDGSDLVQLTRGAKSYSSVTISPDGERMAYVRLDLDAGSGEGPGPEGIYVANADGTDATEVFRSSETPQSIVELQWSPDGRSLGFVLRTIPPGKSSEADWTYELWVMGADGSDPHPVSDDRITSFSWSPAGDRFAVTKETVAGNRSVDDIFVIGLDGSNLARLTSQGASRDPIWSPDGQRILFAEGWMPDGPRVMVMRADGSDVEPLAVRYGGWTEPLAWAADSEQVLVRGGNDRHQCSMLLVSVAVGATSVLLEGTTPLATRSLGPGETPSPIGDPCVESASWSGATPSSQTPAAGDSQAPQTGSRKS
jgi:Tol biopolymer transport system component